MITIIFEANKNGLKLTEKGLYSCLGYLVIPAEIYRVMVSSSSQSMFDLSLMIEMRVCSLQSLPLVRPWSDANPLLASGNINRLRSRECRASTLASAIILSLYGYERVRIREISVTLSW